MTPTPPSTTSSSAGGQSPDAHYRVIRKRNRVPLSCAPCRHRKLKCNRGHPCDNCVKRADTASCTYAAPGNRKRTQSGGGASSSPDEMQNRIDRLEGLVLSLMTNGPQSVGPAAAAAAISGSRDGSSLGPVSSYAEDEMNEDDQKDDESEVEQVSKQIGVMKVTNDRQFFASEAHWWAILSDIAEVKSYFNEHKKQYDEQLRKVKASKGDASVGSALQFKGVASCTQAEILENFPQRPTADRLISRFFSSRDPAFYIIHGPTFQKQYEKHWADPEETSVIWLGMCFAMMSLALQSYHRAGDEPPEYQGKSWQDSLRYSEWTAQCIVYTDYTQPVHYMIETLCFYLQAEYARSRDAETGIWILCGIMTRLALRQGLHRDSKHYAAISPFHGEMRRRLWHVIRSTDVLFSFQVGLQSMLRHRDSDTALPSNIFDDEFDESTQVLPPSRPSNEATPVSYLIAKSKLSECFAKIVELTQSLDVVSYEDTMKLDAELNQVREEIPSHLEMRLMTESVLDPANIIMQRFTLDLSYHKARCVLHRKFLSRSRVNTRYAYSRRSCIDACLEMLAHQATLQAECQPGGRLRSVTWSITSLTTHDFLLAAMIVCLDLYHTAEAESSGQARGELAAWAQERRDEMFAALERALLIWESLRDQSIEAYKASAMLGIMIEKLKHHASLKQQLNSNFSFVKSTGGTAPDALASAPEHTAAMTLGMMSAGGMTPDAMGQYDKNYLGALRTGLTPQPYYANPVTTGESQAMANAGAMDGMNPFANLFGTNIGGFQGMDMTPNNIDWDAWDSYIQGSGMDANASAMMFDPSLVDPNMQPSVAPGMGGMGDAKLGGLDQTTWGVNGGSESTPGTFRSPMTSNGPST